MTSQFTRAQQKYQLVMQQSKSRSKSPAVYFPVPPTTERPSRNGVRMNGLNPVGTPKAGITIENPLEMTEYGAMGAPPSTKNLRAKILLRSPSSRAITAVRMRFPLGKEKMQTKAPLNVTSSKPHHHEKATKSLEKINQDLWSAAESGDLAKLINILEP
jgi:hypothetical protein